MNANQKLSERPPIVAVMGHVDHGKSSLLDYIRKTNTVAGEAGGITQHVAAYEVEHEHAGGKKRITFVDTPGHAAFQAIRARGANVADIAVLVVAADDGVKAQTLEALGQIRAAEIPFIVAINKIDKPNADLARTQASLMEQKVFLEKLGGDTPWVATSAKQGTGIAELLDLILIVAELHEHKAESAKPASGYVLEAHRDPKRGTAATLVITNGTLKSGMAIVAGVAIAPVRVMEDHTGKALKSASFSTPVTIFGFDAMPEAGAEFQSYEKKRDAEDAREKIVEKTATTTQVAVAEGVFSIPVVIRADTQGSVDAILLELGKLTSDRARIHVLQAGIGDIAENDIKLASANLTDTSLVIGFHVGADASARERARQTGVSVELFDIIYKLTERVQEVMQEKTPKRRVDEILGRAKVLKTFSSHKDEHVIGGKVSEGRLEASASVRIMRRNVEIGAGKFMNLQAHKQNVSRIETGSEFGAQVKANFEIAQGDVLECFTSSMQ